MQIENPKYDIHNKYVIIDANCLLYLHGNNHYYEEAITQHLADTMSALNSYKYIGILDNLDSNLNFRKNISTTGYKKNRSKEDLLDRFPYFYEVRELLINKFGFYVASGIEADDVVGIVAEHLKEKRYPDCFKSNDYSYVICSIDKDLKQLKGYHYDLKKHTLSRVDEDVLIMHENANTGKKTLEATGDAMLFAQVLMGDPTDSIIGIPKCGQVKAFKLLESCTNKKEYFEATYNEYIRYYQDKATEMYKENFNLVFIARNNKNINPIEVKYFNNDKNKDLSVFIRTSDYTLYDEA